MNATIRRAYEIRKEAAAKFGGRPGDYSLKIACEMAKNGEKVMNSKTISAKGDKGQDFELGKKRSVAEMKSLAEGLYKENQSLIVNLYSRWLDEKEYEDIADYAAVIKPVVERAGAVFVKMSKRPFGVTFLVDSVTCRISISGGKYRLDITGNK